MRDHRTRVLQWGNGGRAVLPEHGVLGMFSQQVQRTPALCAVQAATDRISYQELDRRSSVLASRLRTEGIRTGDLVGLRLPMSIGFMVTVLAVWKLAATYVPLDASDPVERTRHVLSDAGLDTVVTIRAEGRPVPAGHTVYLDDVDFDAAEPMPGDIQPLSGNEHSTAYVIYTSGSAGVPKGIAVGHRALANYVACCSTLYPLRPGERVAVHSSPSFDLSITSFVYPLTVGAEIVLVPPGIGIESLAEVLTTHGDFGLVKLTPTHLRMLQDLADAERSLSRTRHLVIGGEQLVLDRAVAAHSSSGTTPVMYNEYGPSEATVGCVVHICRPEERGVIPIGRPIGNARIYLLDDALEPALIGAVGRLYVGGECLADGYVNRPAWTAEGFVPDPFDDRSGARMYDTGDLARWQPDGEIEFLGRRDNQVKVRGYRVELGEIEYAMRRIAGIRDAAATASARSDGTTKIQGYYRACGDIKLSPRNVRAWLAELLPAHMVPDTLVEVESIPIAASGKVDLPALAELAARVPRPLTENSDVVGPATQLERYLAAIWAQVLDLESVDVTADFFDLGGQSLLATQVVARIRRELRIDLSLIRLFEHATVRSLATVLEQEGIESGAASVNRFQEGADGHDHS